MPTSPRSKTALFQIDFGEIVTFYKGPMWASAPTDPFFDTLSPLKEGAEVLVAAAQVFFILHFP